MIWPKNTATFTRRATDVPRMICTRLNLSQFGEGWKLLINSPESTGISAGWDGILNNHAIDRPNGPYAKDVPESDADSSEEELMKTGSEEGHVFQSTRRALDRNRIRNGPRRPVTRSD